MKKQMLILTFGLFSVTGSIALDQRYECDCDGLNQCFLDFCQNGTVDGYQCDIQGTLFDLRKLCCDMENSPMKKCSSMDCPTHVAESGHEELG